MSFGLVPLIAALNVRAAEVAQAGDAGESALRGLFGGSPWAAIPSAIVGFILIFAVAGGLPVILVWAERRGAGRIQQRPGPNRVGPFGLFQTIADGFKLMVKEDIIPARASRALFMLAPGIVLAGVLGAFAMLPLSKNAILVDTDLGVFLIFALLSLGVIGVVIAGWASNNKWSILGAMREAAQMVSYEIPLGICVLVAVMHYGTLNLREMCAMQAGGVAGIENWLICQYIPFGAITFVIMYVALLANTKRAPFDLPEAESELVSGFHTEYSGIRFSFFFLEEYAAMFLVSGVIVCTHLGGWNLPFVSGEFMTGSLVGQILSALVVITKALFLVWVMIWVRWTLPRIRIDQVMNLCYKYLTPISFVCLLAVTLWKPFWGWLGLM